MSERDEMIAPHKCNGVDGAERHGTANACNICGRYSSQWYSTPEREAMIEKARAFCEDGRFKHSQEVEMADFALAAERELRERLVAELESWRGSDDGRTGDRFVLIGRCVEIVRGGKE